MPDYKMLRVKAEDYEKLREAQSLLMKKGLDTIDWKALASQKFVEPPAASEDAIDPAVALTLGFVIGVGAAAVAYLVAKHLKEAGTD